MSTKAQANRSNGVVRIFGKPGSALGYMIRDFLHRTDIPYEWIELDSDEEARAQAGASGLNDPRLPVCVFADGTRLECPTIRQIVEKLGWFRDPSRSKYDLAIYGAGPAGLSAAVYAASEGLSAIVVERFAVGGQYVPLRDVIAFVAVMNETIGRILRPRGISRKRSRECTARGASRFTANGALERNILRPERMVMPEKGAVSLSRAQLSMLLEGID